MIEVKCPNCGRVAHAPDGAAGRSAKCAACQQVLIIPTPDQPPVEVPVSPMIKGTGAQSPVRGTVAPPQKQKQEYTFFEGRPYIHSTCGGSTVINEEHFAGLCNPFKPVLGTYCCTCNKPFPCKEFAWADTGERLDEYRKRLRREHAPASLRNLTVGGAVAGALFGLWANFRHFSPGSLLSIAVTTALGWFGARCVAAYLESESKYYKIP